MIASLRQQSGHQPIAVLCSFVQGNQQRWQAGLSVLLEEVDYTIFTAFHGEQDMPKSSVSTEELVEFCENRRYYQYEVENNPLQAYQALLQRPESVLLITGSFYLLNHIRPLILRASE